jgi:hypothetical protein
MGRVLTNNVSLQAAVEVVHGTVPTGATWFLLEPNDVPKIGAEIKTVARSPISKNRQRRKGTVTDLDSAFEVAHDLTMSAFELFIEGFVFATAVNSDCIFRGVTAVSGGYTIPGATAAQAAKFQFNASGPFSLVYGRGYVNAANNGLRALTSDLAAAGTTLPITGSTAETPPTNAEVELCGIRATAGDLAITVSAGVGTLTSGNHSVAGASKIDFTTLGLTVGQVIHVGGLTNTNRFFGAGPIVSYGYGRVRTIAVSAVTLDKLSPTLITSDGTTTGAGGSNVAVDLLFGRFIRNVAVDNVAYLERSFSIEASWTGLQNPSGDEYSYSKGNYCNELTFNLPLANKAGCDYAFVGTDTDNPTTSRVSGASSAISPVKTGALNTSADILRLRVTAIDETGLTTDFKDCKLTLKNNVSPEKVLGTLGARYMNTGNFEVDLEGSILFTEGNVIDAIRANTEVTADFIVKNADGAIAVDIPAMTLGDGSPELPVNESVRLKLTGAAHQHSTLGTSIGVSLFPVVPTS